MHRPRLISPPDPHERLRPWLREREINDSSIELPELRDEISVPVEDPGEELEPGDRFERLAIHDHPEIRELWETYVQDRWWSWAEADRRAQAVHRVYTQLFSIYQDQQRLGEQYEVVLGLGLLAWQTGPSEQAIRRPRSRPWRSRED